MSFAVGMQVVCVNDTFSPCEYWRAAVRGWPRLHGVYTIRAMREVGDLLGLMFYELESPCAQFAEGFVEPAFNSRNFRPVKPTSIDVFRQLLVCPDPIVA